MKQIFILMLCLIIAICASAQTQGDTLLVKQARQLVNEEKFSEALEVFLKAEKTFTADTTEYYGDVQHNIGYCYYKLGDKRNAATYWEKALNIYPQFSDKHGQILEFLAAIYDDLGDQTNLMRILQLTQEHNAHELTKPMVSIKDHIERAQYYAATDNQTQAKSIFLHALDKISTATPQEQEDLYSAYASYLGNNRDHHGAADNYALSANAHKNRAGKDRQWAVLMFLSALHYQIDKQWQSAYDTYAEAKPQFSTADDAKYRRNCSSGMGTCMYFLGNFSEARSLYVETIESFQTDKESADYAKALRNVAKADVKLKRFDEAINYLQTAADIYEKLGDDSNLQATLTELNSAKVKAGQDFDESIDQRITASAKAQSKKILDEERSNLPLYKLQFGDDGISYVRSLGLVAELTYELEDKTKGIELYEDYLKKYRSALRHAFVMQDEKERQRTWAEETLTLDSLVAHNFDYDSTTVALANRLSAMAYDVQLLSKGILLNSSIEFEQVVETYGDEQLKSDYAQIKAINAKIEQLQGSSSTAESLEELARRRQERDQQMLSLMQRCKEMSDFTEYLDYTWRDVQQALGEKDVAIEFGEIKNGVPSSNNVIAAYILTKNMPAPLCIPICLRIHASMMAKDSLVYSNEAYGNLVWGNIMQLVAGCERIYFSPTAEFSSFGIEYLCYQGKPIIDRCEVYRLSSTKELCRHHEPVSLGHVALFGNIDYGSTGQVKTVRWHHTDERSGRESEEQSGTISFNPLRGTSREINEIAKMLKSSKAGEGKTFEGTNASEQTLRRMSGDNQLDVIHIATHGQYYGTRKATEAEAMQCSVLAFSGANIPNDDVSSDGIVTAQDIAAMNLRHCGMAVLSACETGLGKLGSDGVFGLQRGFKNAGVHTLLMSLSKVNDTATTELMIQFYKSLATNGVTPNAALRQAQNYLRTHGYNNPRLWASFIILDGQ